MFIIWIFSRHFKLKYGTVHSLEFDKWLCQVTTKVPLSPVKDSQVSAKRSTEVVTYDTPQRFTDRRHKGQGSLTKNRTYDYWSDVSDTKSWWLLSWHLVCIFWSLAKRTSLKFWYTLTNVRDWSIRSLNNYYNETIIIRRPGFILYCRVDSSNLVDEKVFPNDWSRPIVVVHLSFLTRVHTVVFLF